MEDSYNDDQIKQLTWENRNTNTNANLIWSWEIREEIAPIKLELATIRRRRREEGKEKKKKTALTGKEEVLVIKIGLRTFDWNTKLII